MGKHVGLSLIVTGTFLSSCVRRGEYGPQAMWGWDNMMHYGFGYGGMFMWIIFLIVVGVLIYFIIQAQKTKGRQVSQHEGAMEVLKMRYAKGEIGKEEFDRMKKDIEG